MHAASLVVKGLRSVPRWTPRPTSVRLHLGSWRALSRGKVVAGMFEDNYRCRQCGYSTYVRDDLQFFQMPKCPRDGTTLVPIKNSSWSAYRESRPKLG